MEHSSIDMLIRAEVAPSSTPPPSRAASMAVPSPSGLLSAKLVPPILQLRCPKPPSAEALVSPLLWLSVSKKDDLFHPAPPVLQTRRISVQYAGSSCQKTPCSTASPALHPGFSS